MTDAIDDAEIEALYRRLFPMIQAKCQRMLKDPAEAQDIAQETFTRLWTRRCESKDTLALTAWLYRTSTRLAIDRMRHLQRQRPVADAEVVAPPTPGPHERTDARWTFDRLVARTPASELEAVVLSSVDGLTHAEIAEVMGNSERTVRRLLARFRERRTTEERHTHV